MFKQNFFPFKSSALFFLLISSFNPSSWAGIGASMQDSNLINLGATAILCSPFLGLAALDEHLKSMGFLGAGPNEFELLDSNLSLDEQIQKILLARQRFANRSEFMATLFGKSTVGLFLGGTIVLDDSQSSLWISPVNDEQVREFQEVGVVLSPEEINSVNGDVDRINTFWDEVNHQLAVDPKPVTLKRAVEEQKKYEKDFSPLTKSALGKMSFAALKVFHAHKIEKNKNKVISVSVP
jgi:hypothetical protein